MTQKTPVPRLDLAPKLKRPLSLWNPLDYLRLLYWVFYFPQALRWYVDTFGGGYGYIPFREINWQNGWESLQNNTVQRSLLFQGLLLIVVISLILSRLLQLLGIPIDWSGVAGGISFGVAFGMGFGIVKGLVGRVVESMANAIALAIMASVGFGVVESLIGGIPGGGLEGMAAGTVMGIAFGVAFGVAIFLIKGFAKGLMAFLILAFTGVLVGNYIALGVTNIMSSVVIGVVLGMVGGLAFNVTVCVAAGIVLGVARGIVLGMALGVAFGVATSIVGGITFGLALGVAGGIVFCVVILRPESWLISLPLYSPNLQNGSLLFSRVSSLPLPYLNIRLNNWLQQDWETALHNVNQLLAYTLQFIPVVKAVNKVFHKIPSEQIIFRIAQLAEEPLDWNLVRFVSTDLNETLKFETIKNLNNRFPKETRLDTPARASAAGFWYLHEKQPAKAEEAFTVVRPILYGEEMYTLAKTLAVFQGTKYFDDIARVSLENLDITYIQSSQKKLLRPITWQAISSLHRVVEDTQVVKRSVSRATRSFTLNRALGELTNILNNSQTLPEAERELIVDIAETWQKALLQIAGEVGEATITKPVRNPYIIGDPVIGEKFVGREEVMRQLEELWVMGEQLQSVVIYGHRRMGKTSILRNAANSIGSGVKVAYVNMLNAGNISEGVGEVLMVICDVVSEAVNVPPPDDDKLLQLPERTFQRYLKQVVNQLHETPHGTSLGGLIIAIDEFEVIEELITEGQIPKNFLGYLRGLLQMNSKIAFAFAGLHTLEEMTADYFQPFFASVIPIKVGFMERAVTRQILANPSLVNPNINKDGLENTEEFLLDYKPEALDKIYELTHGQPYLVQLIGFVLVRRYNDQVFELGRKRDSIFTVEDVEAVINNTEFFKRGRYYFEGVWSQARQGAEGQQAVLKLLAPHPEGLNFDDVIREVSIQGFDEATLQQALETLKRHDVIEETQQGKWRIIVELFRRWLVQQIL